MLKPSQLFGDPPQDIVMGTAHSQLLTIVVSLTPPIRQTLTMETKTMVPILMTMEMTMVVAEEDGCTSERAHLQRILPVQLLVAKPVEHQAPQEKEVEA